MSDLVVMDQNHIEFIYGCLVAKKPQDILEVGVGKAAVTEFLVKGTVFNRSGVITCVDNWLDTGGQEPDFMQRLKTNVNFVLANEGDFVSSTLDAAYDFLVFDADHHATDQRIDDILRIAKPGAFLFFHDIMTQDFSNLYGIVERVKSLGLPYYIFDKSTRYDERCERGLLFVMKP